MPLNFVCRYKKLLFCESNYQTMNNNKKNHIKKWQNKKNQNEHLNVEDALTQSEAFLVKYKTQSSAVL